LTGELSLLSLQRCARIESNVMRTPNTLQAGLLRNKAVFITGGDIKCQIVSSDRGTSKQGIADLALFLVSESGYCINGVMIPIEGGFSAVDSLEFVRMVKDSQALPVRAAA
jgi:hypothetical protein